MVYVTLLYTAIIVSINITLSVTSLGLLGVPPNGVTYWMAVKLMIRPFRLILASQDVSTRLPLYHLHYCCFL